MTRQEALICLNLVPDLGTIRLNKLLQVFDKPQGILKAPQDKLIAVSGIGQKIADKICSLKKEDLSRELESAKKLGLEIITIDDQGYPENLKNIADPPIVLYVKGELWEEDKDSLAIVGSRRASYYGLSCAEKFAGDLSGKGFTVVSGMARGIDASAHKGALKRGGRTIAVMGSGFNHIYPPENRKLCQEIAANGAVVSEFPVDREPWKLNFPRRNRIISGLAKGVLVVEAAKNSGALITADFALEQGREVFALPGKIDSYTSFGTNQLLKQGAKLVSCVDDIIEEFQLPVAGKIRASSGVKDILKSDLDNQESLMYDFISAQPVLLDEIMEKSGVSISQAYGLILKLEMKKLIRRLPGQQLIRN